jgi:hypothetical protein
MRKTIVRGWINILTGLRVLDERIISCFACNQTPIPRSSSSHWGHCIAWSMTMSSSTGLFLNKFHCTGWFVSPSGCPTSAVQQLGCSNRRGTCHQRERHSKFLSYITGARNVNPRWRDVCKILANSKTQTAFLFPVHAMFRHDCPLAVKPASTPRRLVHKKTWRDSLSIDMLLSAASVLAVAQPISNILKGLMNYPILVVLFVYCD